MKVFISADIEGVACISAASETDKGQPAEHAPFARQMTDEVGAACAGAYAAGAQGIVIKDAHWTGRNLDPHRLAAPEGRQLRLIRGWSGHPFAMVQGLDASFERAAFIGYHSAASCGGNPLAHTMSSRLFSRVELNGALASEFRIYAMAAASVGVPVAFLSGDKALCEEAQALIDGIVTVATLEGFGPSVQSMLPAEALARIEKAMYAAVAGKPPRPLDMPREFCFKMTFIKAADAYVRSFMPGLRQISDTELLLETSNYFDVLAALMIAVQIR
jgi:D-amino peptidase